MSDKAKSGSVVLRPANATNAAQNRCAMWLAFCVDDGADKSTLDELENLWWKHHDRWGNLKSPTGEIDMSRSKSLKAKPKGSARFGAAPGSARCEGWRRNGGVFTFGPVRWEQCNNAGIVMLKFKQDGKVKTLPACKECWAECLATGITIIEARPLELSHRALTLGQHENLEPTSNC